MLTLYINVNSYRAINALRFGYKTSQSVMNREIVFVCTEIHTKHINTTSEHNVELGIVKTITGQ